MFLMIVQIAGASGTLPAVLSRGVIQSITGFLPFTYCIDAMREVMSGGDWATVAADLGTLAAMGAVALACTLLLYPIGPKIAALAESNEAQKRNATKDFMPPCCP